MPNVEIKMSSTQESDGNFRSWFGDSKWKTALYVGLPLLGVGIVGVLLWRRHTHSGEDTISEQPDDVTVPDPVLVWFCPTYHL